jgi:hypothetical protein
MQFENLKFPRTLLLKFSRYHRRIKSESQTSSRLLRLCFFAPPGLVAISGPQSHGLRSGPNSFAGPRLGRTCAEAAGGAKSRINTAFPSVLDRPTAHQIGKLTVFLNCPLQLFPFICYKQFTESSVWLTGRIVCNSRARPASKVVESVKLSSRPGHGT